MDAQQSYQQDVDGLHLRPGTGGSYVKPAALRPGKMLGNLLSVVPELKTFAQLDLKVAFNLDSSNVGPREWIQLAKILDRSRDRYDAFLIAHGTDTLSYTASALSLMLAGFRRPIVITGSQLPLALPRSDARQNLLDSICCATAAFNPPHHVHLQEVAVCFGGKLLRGNRSQKTNSSAYQAFDSPNFPPLATLGVDISWNAEALLKVDTVYRPRFMLDPRVIRIPIIPGSDPRQMYGDVAARGVKGVVLEAFGVGNMPDRDAGWLPWLRDQRKKGVLVYLSSQCTAGPLHPELYKSGSAALKLGVESGPQMTPECAVVKCMLVLAYEDLPLGWPLAGEL